MDDATKRALLNAITLSLLLLSACEAQSEPSTRRDSPAGSEASEVPAETGEDEPLTALPDPHDLSISDGAEGSVVYCYAIGGQWYLFTHMMWNFGGDRPHAGYRPYPHPECLPKEVREEASATPFDVGGAPTYVIRSKNPGALGFDRTGNYRWRHWNAKRCTTDAECAALKTEGYPLSP